MLKFMNLTLEFMFAHALGVNNMHKCVHTDSTAREHYSERLNSNDSPITK